MASGYLKELTLNSPRDFFFPVLLSFSGQLRVCLVLENPGNFEEENLWWFMVAMELCRLIYYTKMMLVTPYQVGIPLKACSVVEIDGIKPSSLLSPKVLKYSALVWGPDVWSVLGMQPGVMEYFFSSVNLIVSLASLAMRVTTFPSGFPVHGHLLRL